MKKKLSYVFIAMLTLVGFLLGAVSLLATPVVVPVLSPQAVGDTGLIAFTSDRDGNYEIYVMNPDGSNLTRLPNNGTADSSPTWSPDGTQIAYVRGTGSSSDEIYVMNADGSNVKRLTNDGVRDEWPAWSPDGAKIAYTSNEDVYVMNADGSNPQ